MRGDLVVIGFTLVGVASGTAHWQCVACPILLTPPPPAQDFVADQGMQGCLSCVINRAAQRKGETNPVPPHWSESDPIGRCGPAGVGSVDLSLSGAGGVEGGAAVVVQEHVGAGCLR